MMNNSISIKQVVRLKESILPDEGPWFLAKGSQGTVIGHDGHLLRIRMDEYPMIQCVDPRLVEVVFLASKDVA